MICGRVAAAFSGSLRKTALQNLPQFLYGPASMVFSTLRHVPLLSLLLLTICSGCTDEAAVDSGSDASENQTNSDSPTNKTSEGEDTAKSDTSEGHDKHACVVVTADNFEEVVLKSDKPVLVDFWATWCGPCLAIAPNIEELAKKYKGRAVIAKIDVDENVQIAEKYEVQGMPFFVYFKSGEKVDAMLGLPDRDMDKAAAVIEAKLQGLLPEASDAE